ncbi:MAG: Rpn family recombination-promoting nuclease/putative transposase [Myxococcales bacterium]|nr:Rpn family recombination-promoting nuclease/putative transposase [Myxococcales bacterium]
MPRLDPTLDLVFRLMLTRRTMLLLDMLEGILARPIRALSLIDAEIPGELPHDKHVILDIRARLHDGSRVDVEMQRNPLPALTSRLAYYTARDYGDQLHLGDGYGLLTATTGIVWSVSPLFPSLDRLHCIFELRERHTGTRFSDQLAIHVLQLSVLAPHPTNRYDAKVARWARFFTARDDAERVELASEDPIMRIALETLDQLSEDPQTRRLAREREDAIVLYRMHLAASRAEGEAEGEAKGKAEGEAKGKAEGEAKGKAEVLIKLLGLRFGPLPESLRARVQSAAIDQLDAWTDRVLTAQTLEDALAP